MPSMLKMSCSGNRSSMLQCIFIQLSYKPDQHYSIYLEAICPMFPDMEKYLTNIIQLFRYMEYLVNNLGWITNYVLIFSCTVILKGTFIKLNHHKLYSQRFLPIE